jgi:hypothetical protein
MTLTLITLAVLTALLCVVAPCMLSSQLTREEEARDEN